MPQEAPGRAAGRGICRRGLGRPRPGFTTHVSTRLASRNIYGYGHAQGTDMRTVMEIFGRARMATTADLYTHVLAEVKATTPNGWTPSCAG